MTISKERDIVLTSYEQRSLLRFLSLYLSSVFVLLAIIGYLFFENNRTSMTSAMKFEMMYQARMLSSKIIMRAMKKPIVIQADKQVFLKTLKHCRFSVGYYDIDQRSIFSEIKNFTEFNEPFFAKGNDYYSVLEDTSAHMGVRYIVLKENNFSGTLQKLRIKIIGYLVLSFILMGIVGYFLGRLFLRPVREQIESLDRFISDTTHELNTPISVILMTIQSLKGIEAKKMKRLEASAKRLSTMYSSLTYRLEGMIEPDEMIDMKTIIEERVEYAKELMESKRLKLTMELEPTFLLVSKRSADRLIDNLLSNAIKYSDMGGNIEISLHSRVLKVKDTGIGIDQHLQKDIFKRYIRANEERGGFGIGLNIVHSICSEYNIKLEVESKKGGGSTFTLQFPPLKH
ncbi:MAG: HAMP domain-containing histidine kinase [Campylobacterales bacterium]|nr:HAMP domain-containing histidine kinase [Campylobacterales bacterium]